jgi:nucleotide-binding universal stress UspA family protein
LGDYKFSFTVYNKHMEKILLALDADNIDIPAIEFACYVAALSRSKLRGVFIGGSQKVDYASQAASAVVNASAEATPQPFFNENSQLFDNFCTNHCVRSELMHLPSKHALADLIAESRFADLIILKADTCFQDQPSTFATDLLSGAECPVLVAPAAFNGIDEIIFAYDGSQSSVFAIKQFTYLFPRLSDKRAMLLEVTDSANGELTQKDKIRELLKAHYAGIGYHMLHGKANDELFAYLLHKKTSMVVMGAFGKKLIKHSTASQLLKTIDCPFFITHCQ